MKISTLLAFVAILGTGMTATFPVSAASAATDDQACHFLPVADSSASLKQARSVGVLYSENTVNTLQYLERYHSVALNGSKNDALDSRISTAFINSSDPKLAIDWLKASLQKQFTSVTVYDNLDAVVQARPDVVVMLDTYSRLVTKRNNQFEARFVAKFYDSNLQYIGKAEGSTGKELPSVWVRGKAAPEIAAQIDQQRELQVDALKQFDASLKALVTSGDADQVATN
ncbi:ATPase [Pseudomonas gingeri]|uniref:ATPase n=1 Tax=Pseudomonas gingeri TaxID=117681 RepID=A0A7Y8CL94_9PSED|nr:ATPase [Pseudomonas gingeri]NWB29060.1 ATPase [Pseudomonas gingeri]NWC34385.1 ATPase [Pseudomonas gingeri]NWD06562.1 ATPase [Pseudomonas gingeri]NWE33158.1 ATPase [Pseudomonas gingeri]NWE55505.1 ATPase [Pseudomonas gingeri]